MSITIDRFSFRVWNVALRKMCYNIMIGTLKEHETCFFYYDFQGGKQTIVGHLEYIMQSLGKKDINGKLIYENDILKVYYENSIKCDNSYKKEYLPISPEKIILVEWNNNSLLYESIDNVNYNGYKSFEIIGNVFENPDLYK